MCVCVCGHVSRCSDERLECWSWSLCSEGALAPAAASQQHQRSVSGL